MRPTWWQFCIGVATALLVLFGNSGGGGIGISTPPESPDTVLVSSCTTPPAQALFFPLRPGNPPFLRNRDLEFLWDSLYSGARGYFRFSATDRALRALLGAREPDAAEAEGSRAQRKEHSEHEEERVIERVRHRARIHDEHCRRWARRSVRGGERGANELPEQHRL